MRYSIIMPYINRYQQLKATLASFKRLYSHRDDWEVIIVEDVKNVMHDTNHRDLHMALAQCGIDNIQIVVSGNVAHANPSELYNHGAKSATGEFLIITSPECLHENDVLGAFDEAMTTWPISNSDYFVASCKAHESAKREWFQHSVHRPMKYHFCSCISKRCYEMIGGFDEDYSAGYAYDDNDFRDRIIYHKFRIAQIDNAIVRHQEHVKDRPANYTAMLKRNKELYALKSAERGMEANSDC